MEALDFPCILAQHWCLGEEGTKLPPGIFVSLCHSYRALGLAHYEDRQGGRRGCICVTGWGQQLQTALCLIGFLPFPLY